MRVQRFAAAAALPSRLCRLDAASIRTSPNSWSVAQRDRIIEVGYGNRSDFPQYAALHTDSSFLRLNYGLGGDEPRVLDREVADGTRGEVGRIG